MQQAVSKFHILKIEVAHGSDRHDIGIYSEKPATVNELLDELEKKTRVPRSSIQVIFKGQKLHNNPSENMASFGIFNGSRLLMVGEKLGVNSDAVFRRILGVSKDVTLIAKSLSELTAEFDCIEKGGFETKKLGEYLPQMNKRAYGMKQDLEVFLRIVQELNVDERQLPDVKRHQCETIKTIKGHIQAAETLMQRISKIKF